MPSSRRPRIEHEMNWKDAERQTEKEHKVEKKVGKPVEYLKIF